jgi:glycosyltransferase involved in cell wall biosynthesis
MPLPKVSIVIPSYKAGHFEQCLKSAIGQTYPNTEIVVSDNCPTEDIRHICEKYRHNGVLYQRSTALRDQNVLGVFYTGKGDLIKPLFDDDILHPFCVERMVAAIAMDPATQLVFSASQVINADNERTETRRPYQHTGSMPGRDLHRSMALGMRNFIGEFTSIMFRRETLWKIGMQDLFRIGQHDFTFGLADVAAYCNLARDGNAFYIDEELSYFRRDQRVASNSNPESNPDFGNCFSDYIDLLVVSHQAGVITTEEVLGLREQVADVSLRLTGIFAQVGTSERRYLNYLDTLSRQ